MRRFTLAGLALTGLVAAAPLQAQPPGLASLEHLFTLAGPMGDRDGDGRPDGAAVTIVPESADAAVVAAAGELAARFGLETCALDGSLLAAGAGPRIRVLPPLAAEGLEGGRAVITEGGLRLVADSDRSLLAVARAVAGWLPRAPRGGSLAKVREWIAARAATAAEADVRFDLLEVAAGAPRWKRLRARVVVAKEHVAAVANALGTADPEDGAPALAGVERLDVEVGDGDDFRTARTLAAPGAADDLEPLDGVKLGGKARRFGLQQLFGVKGLLLDADGDLVPDGCAARVVPSGEPGCEAAVDVAARLGLESAGLRFPLTALPAEPDPAKIPGPLVLVGERQPLVEHLVAEGRVTLDALGAAEGEVLLVLEAFGKQPAVILRGADATGLRNAGSLLLRRVPHLSDGRHDAPSLTDLSTEVRRLVAGVSPLGQASRVHREVGILKDRPGVGEDSRVAVALEGLPADATARTAVRRHWEQTLRMPLERVEEVDLRREDGRRTVVDVQKALPFETERVTRLLRTEVLPQVGGAGRVEVEVFVSEAPREREALAERIREGLRSAGVGEQEVRVLSAYKPGFSWLTEEVLPRLERRALDRLEVAAPVHTERSAPRWSTLHARGRWFQELHPALDLLARGLNVELDEELVFAELPEPEAGPDGLPRVRYEVRAWPTGRTRPLVFSMEPALRRIPFSRVFPGYESVIVTTGRVRVWVDGRSVLDRKVPTDLESVWEAYQDEVLAPLRDHLMDVSRGRPGDVKPPLFGLLDARVYVSEADRKLDVGHELISPAEALYEEIYFHSLWFASFVGQVYTGKPLRFPGSVVPDVRVRPGEPPAIRVRIEGRALPGPGVRALHGDDRVVERRLPVVKLDEPRIVRLRIDARGFLDVRVRVRCQADEDDWKEHVSQARPELVDERLLAAATGVAVVREAAVLRGLGGYRDAFVYPGVARIEVEFDAPGGRRLEALDADPRAFAPPEAPDAGAESEVVPQRDAISPEDAGRILAALARAHGGGLHRLGRTYLGRAVWALETGPVGATHYSRAKLAAWKPVLVISAREHANEVSSTNTSLLFLREVLQDADALRDVTFVVKPVWNADGAVVAIAQAGEHPNWMLHAGYLGALGENVSAGTNDPDPVYPEAHLRLELFRRHLPDVLVNPHGYPTHEWVQPFSGYAAWVRGREPEARDWWGVRGWFLQHFTWPRGEEYEEQRGVAHALRDRICKAVAAHEPIMELNREQYARYMRYGAFDPDVYRMPLVHGVQVNGPPGGSKPKKDSTNFALRHPKTVAFQPVCEVPDETARDAYLRMICETGTRFLEACLAHLREGELRLETDFEEFRDGAVRKRARKRPVLAGGAGGPGSAR